jgi:predicted SprT family Zn-dependent metalloprotease
MTVEILAIKLGLWTEIREKIKGQAGDQEQWLLEQLAPLPIRRSRATRSLGSYVSRKGVPVCIRLQFAQEPENLKQTLLHEIAHACDHLVNQLGRQYRRAHGAQWQAWAKAFGTPAKSCGDSEALKQLYQQRLKLVAVCQRCGAEYRRIRAFNRRRKYFHAECGGRLRPV